MSVPCCIFYSVPIMCLLCDVCAFLCDVCAFLNTPLGAAGMHACITPSIEHCQNASGTHRHTELAQIVSLMQRPSRAMSTGSPT